MKNLSAEKFLLLKQNPSAKAIISSSATFTFDQLRQKVLTTASYLNNQNISSDDRVGIFSKNNIEFVINVLALWQISAIPVPINIRLTEIEIEDQLTRANCSSILVHKEFLGTVNGKKRNIIRFPFEISTNEFKPERDKINLEEPAVIIFTSGSTHKSKGIILSFNSLYHSAINSNQLLRYTRSDSWMASLPFYHVGGFSIITRALLFGIPLIIPDSISTHDLLNSLNKFQPTHISLVASQLKKMIDEKVSPNPELKNCLVGGGFTDLELMKNSYELGWPLNVVYGSTETSSFVTALLKDEIIIKPNSVGRAVPTNKIKIDDSFGNEQKPFEIGEITVQSNSLMSGYLDETETTQVIKDGYYFTNDLGYMDDDGYLFIVGRKNYMISTGGENVNPVEVENALLQHPQIKEAAVFPLKDKEWGELIAASIVLKDNSIQLSSDEVKLFLREKLSVFKIPKKIFFEEYLPKTELGKIEKQILIDRYKLTSL